MYRKRAKKNKDKRIFTTTAQNTHPMNLRNIQMRGGYRV